MLEAAPRRDVQATWTSSTPQERQRRRLLVAIVLLLSALILILAKDREFWFGAEETSAAEDVQFVPAVSTPAQSPALPAKTTNPVAPKHALQPGPKRAALPPLEVNVVAGSAHNAAQVRTNRASSTVESVQMASIKAPAVDSAYPLLTGQMSVQGSVLMQALIAADGVVEDLRVLSGPTILVSAAREAVRQWRFKPYLENGKPVETSARVTVNFTIKVSNNTARYQSTSITSDGAL
ncbi:MAG TPA: TonB family protein [Terriglobales bacterium]|nr:TonB family protein [Terriglobales bacterium]